jgi:Ni,Fe-hydrogenase III large subunit/Ni,Fe-hydrogenase III component G
MPSNIGRMLVSALGAGNALAEAQSGAPALRVPVELFARAAGLLKSADSRLCAEWAVDETPFGRGFSVWAAYNRGTEYLLVTSPLPAEAPAFPTLTGHYVSAYRFERRIMSLMGVNAGGHPDPRPWIKHEDWPVNAHPLKKSFDASSALPRVEGEYRWITAKGEGVFEIPVGPVHAGIIEPGHFRFLAVGERILNMEEKLGYVHKGIEKRFESLSWGEGSRLAGRVSGDTTVAHALAYSLAVENAAGFDPPVRAAWIRALLLERERIVNHLADLAAMCNDVAFTFAYYQFWILREKMLRTNRQLFGHRLMMDMVIPGGVRADIGPDGEEMIVGEITGMLEEYERLIDIYDDNPSLKDRLYNSGVLAPSKAKDMGVVGVAGRASGQAVDARLQWPFLPYDAVIPKHIVLHSGDVHARAWVRIEEIRDSARLALEMLAKMPEGKIFAVPPIPVADAKGFSVVEGWRGEILYWIHAGADGRPNRCMVRDPSAVNWLALEQSISEDMVPDFPLVNKSFNNSYSGNDL